MFFRVPDSLFLPLTLVKWKLDAVATTAAATAATAAENSSSYKKQQKPTAAVFKVATVIHLAASNWRSLNSKLKTENRKPKTQSQNETSTSASAWASDTDTDSDSDSDSAASSALGLFGIDLTPCRLNLWSESAPESPSPSRIQRLKRSWSRCSALLSLPVCR